MAAPVDVYHDETSIIVSWVNPTSDGSSPILHFKLLMKAGYHSDYSTVYEGYSFSNKITNLTSGFQYTFKVISVNKAGESEESDPSTQIYTATKPSPPLGLDLIDRSSSHIAIKWDYPKTTGGVPLLGFKLFRSEDSNAYIEISFPANVNPAIQE